MRNRIILESIEKIRYEVGEFYRITKNKEQAYERIVEINEVLDDLKDFVIELLKL